MICLGNPEPLVFHAPQVFFDCLQQRISSGNRKKRLPNYTTGFVRKDALPLGMFTKYTWHITNILQVKQIFDTTDVSNFYFLCIKKKNHLNYIHIWYKICEFNSKFHAYPMCSIPCRVKESLKRLSWAWQ